MDPMTPVAKPGFFKRSKNRLFTKLGSIRAEPRQIAAGYALGFLIGTTPLIGMKVLIALALSSVLKLSRPAAVIGVYHINSLTGPFFHALAFVVGRAILGTKITFVFPEKLEPKLIFQAFYGNGQIFLALALGGLVMGIPISIFLYKTSFRIVKKLRISAT
jgi:uncharacterized protein (DUF2062 family)